MQLEPMKATLKAPVIRRLKLNMMNCFQVLLSISTCASTPSASPESPRHFAPPAPPDPAIATLLAGAYTRIHFSSN